MTLMKEKTFAKTLEWKVGASHLRRTGPAGVGF